MDKQEAQYYGVLDIGTLKVKCLVAAVSPSKRITKVYTSAELTCFGCDMVDGAIVDANLTRTIAELKRCQKIFKKYGVRSYRVVSTHALRQAHNRQEVIDRIRKETGLAVENISSEQEAALFFKAVLRDFPADQSYALVDMGGGSMQVIIGKQGQAQQEHLLPLGSATLHEKFTRNASDEHSFNTPEDIEKMKEYILEQIIGIEPAEGLPIIYGSTNVLDMMQALKLPLELATDSPSHPYKTYAAHLDEFITKVLPLTFAEREEQYQFQRVYMWGIDKAFLNVILLSKRFGSPYILPSNANLAEGLIYSMENA
jgi:exopolyphosphatase / guanosine-5'-triphosphate,3'-diphosphate pyrophosphatase